MILLYTNKTRVCHNFVYWWKLVWVGQFTFHEISEEQMPLKVAKPDVLCLTWKTGSDWTDLIRKTSGMLFGLEILFNVLKK